MTETRNYALVVAGQKLNNPAQFITKCGKLSEIVEYLTRAEALKNYKNYSELRKVFAFEMRSTTLFTQADNRKMKDTLSILGFYGKSVSEKELKDDIVNFHIVVGNTYLSKESYENLKVITGQDICFNKRLMIVLRDSLNNANKVIERLKNVHNFQNARIVTR